MEDVLDRVKAALADRFAIDREIGRGGMATVYLAEDLKHHRKVAIKVLRPELAATLGVDRFLHEIEIAARLTHPHIQWILSIENYKHYRFLLYNPSPPPFGDAPSIWLGLNDFSESIPYNLSAAARGTDTVSKP